MDSLLEHQDWARRDDTSRRSPSRDHRERADGRAGTRGAAGGARVRAAPPVARALALADAGAGALGAVGVALPAPVAPGAEDRLNGTSGTLALGTGTGRTPDAEAEAEGRAADGNGGREAVAVLEGAAGLRG
ncbi:hypothetical protein GGX14DRAFT_399778 [Mycena pura]|uniref:Uncharacterized protein n=1 Tax=Mycena pura TaxID=153505 RepID=A0AAD6Y8A3_9AGAR|nr:hypothetical protein GGX14DRAFT_399778 [Mycena pura]